MDISQLTKNFAIENRIKFISGEGGWTYVHLENNGSTAFVSLYGAHVLHYTPQGEKEVLWNTPKSFFEQGKPVRGGIPVCWPWFGPHASDPSKPAHGFARLFIWDVLTTKVNQLNETELVLSLTDSAETLALWPYSFNAIIRIRLGKKLTVELSVLNTGIKQFSMSEALHTYFQVSDASKISIEGLEGKSYLDGTNQNASMVQKEKFIEIKKEENRRYLDTTSTCIINDPEFNRKIKVEKANSNTTVIWNPWIETARSMADFDDDGYKTMVCVEAANAFTNAVTLMPEEKFTMATSIEIIK